MPNNNKIQLGTISHGTLRDRDLLPAFADELARVDAPFKQYSALLAEIDVLIHELNDPFDDSILDWQYDDVCASTQSYVADLINEQLHDALNGYALPHTYFGTLDGDASDFGYWPIDFGSFEDCEMHVIDDENKLDLDCHVHVHVNDHGNVTVSTIARGNELWSVV